MKTRLSCGDRQIIENCLPLMLTVSMTDITLTPRGREQVAERLLSGSVRRSYAPVVDIDWDAPIVEGKYYLPPEACSLYGTEIWANWTEEQRIESSRQELTNLLSMGIWFENLLNRLLLGDTRCRNFRRFRRRLDPCYGRRGLGLC